MKQRLLGILLSLFSFILPMRHHHHAADFLMIDKSDMPFVFDEQKTATLNDTDYIYPVDTKTLMILIAEVHHAAQSRSIPPFFELLEKIKKGIITLNHFSGTTRVTHKDIEGRLLCYIRAFGTCSINPGGDDPYSGGSCSASVKIPIVFENTLAYLHHFKFGPSIWQITKLEDFPSFKEISSRKLEDCQKRVEEIVNRYHSETR
jgi:hypothetical protein